MSLAADIAAREILNAGAERAARALKITGIAPAGRVQNGQASFVISFDTKRMKAEFRQTKNALIALHHRLRGPRVVRGDRCGRRRRRS